jgi:hypothetical protein
MLWVCRAFMVASLAALAVLVNAGVSEAQVFRFQLQPFCDKITLAVVPSSAESLIGIVGYDDNCGESPRSPVYGTLVVNPDNSMTIGFTLSLPVSVYQTSDVAVQVNVEWPAGSNAGVWSNDQGQSGTFVFDILDQPSD